MSIFNSAGRHNRLLPVKLKMNITAHGAMFGYGFVHFATIEYGDTNAGSPWFFTGYAKALLELRSSTNKKEVY